LKKHQRTAFAIGLPTVGAVLFTDAEGNFSGGGSVASSNGFFSVFYDAFSH